MKKILVLGASGSLGRALVKYLKHNYEVTATYSNNIFFEDDVEIRQVDIVNQLSLDQLGGEYDVAVLIAGAMPATMRGYHPHRYIDTNIAGALNVLEYCRKYKIKKIIYIMTFSDVSHKFYSGIPIKSDDERKLILKGDHAVYAISKVAALDLIEHYHQEYGLQSIVFRIPTVYCADQNFDYYVDGEKRIKAYIRMIKSIVSDSQIEMWGNPENAKDMPYVKDFARLIDLAVNHSTAQGIYNAGTGMPITLSNFIETLIGVFSPDKKVEIIPRPDKPSQPNFTFDMTKTKNVFDFEPIWSLENMFKDIRDIVGIQEFRR